VPVLMKAGATLSARNMALLRDAYMTGRYAKVVELIDDVWKALNYDTVAWMFELSRPTRTDSWLDAADGLVSAGLPLPRSAAEALSAVDEVLMRAELPALPSREKWRKMAGPPEANWRFLRGCALINLDRVEAAAEFRRAANGGNNFAWTDIALLTGSCDESELKEAVDAGDEVACGILALRLPQNSTASRRRRMEFAGLGVESGDVASICVVSIELAKKGRRAEARRLLRKLERAPMHLRFMRADLEYEALRASGRLRAAEHFGRMMAIRGHKWLGNRLEFLETLIEKDPDSARAFVLLQREGVCRW
jgi:hypothetical protein